MLLAATGLMEGGADSAHAGRGWFFSFFFHFSKAYPGQGFSSLGRPWIGSNHWGEGVFLSRWVVNRSPPR